MGVELEGGCQSDWRERRMSELRGKRGEKGDIIAVPPTKGQRPR